MVLRYAFLASAAELNREQRVSALGIGIHGLLVPQLPAVVPSLVLVLQIHFDLEDCGVPHGVRVTAEGPDRVPMGIGASTNLVGELPPYFPEHGSASDSLFTFYNVSFDQEGIYQIHIEIDGKRIKTVNFAVVVVRQSSTGG